MNSTYVPNSQPIVPTRVCEGHVVTTDLPTLGTNPKQSQSESETQEAKDLDDLWSPRQTVRGDRADGPSGGGGRSAGQVRIVRKWKPNLQNRTQKNRQSVPYPRTVREQIVSCGQSATLRRTVHKTSLGQKQLPKWIETKELNNTQRTWWTTGWKAPRGQFVYLPRTVRQAREQQPEPETASTQAPIRPWISQTAWALEERFGEDVKLP
jgi:hypothetical protein